MADNDKNNMSGDSRVPKSTKGLEGSVSLEDLKKYHLIDTGDENTPTNNTVSDDQTSNDEPKQASGNPTPAGVDHLQAEESNDHLSEAKHDAPEVDETKVEPTPVPPVTPKESTEDSKAEPDQAQDDSSDQEDVKPWEKSFDSDTDDEGHVSRAVTKEKQRGNHTLVVTLVVALIVIMFTPVIINAVRGSSSGDLDSSQSESSVENKDKSTKKKTAKKSTKKKAAKKSTKKASAKKTTTDNDSKSNTNANNSNTASDSTAANSTTADSSNSQTTDSSQQQAQQSQQTQQSQQSDQQASTGTTANNSSTTSTDSDSSNSASYYTVKAGDNWFRIAYNNNLTTAQLKSMNSNVGTLTPGTTLRVK
ncbi:LysM peptidoglycan-binding domain-containing protein [Companilactobacillus formosensis]|jgi:hypothetical protein|uniref:LysM peptidoglycan-binding domain-containing protein n=1 Tax=Companilactobacillus formosensis TaxID=1617889 RepID=UPI000E652550|nr:LysM domain-containing protein [Companilactobacillus formosensis]